MTSKNRKLFRSPVRLKVHETDDTAATIALPHPWACEARNLILAANIFFSTRIGAQCYRNIEWICREAVLHKKLHELLASNKAHGITEG